MSKTVPEAASTLNCPQSVCTALWCGREQQNHDR